MSSINSAAAYGMENVTDDTMTDITGLEARDVAVEKFLNTEGNVISAENTPKDGVIGVESSDVKRSGGDTSGPSIEDTKFNSEEMIESYDHLPIEFNSQILNTGGDEMDKSETVPSYTRKMSVIDFLLNAEAVKDPKGFWWCKRCGVLFSRNHTLLNHLKTRHNISFTYCGLEYCTPESLRGREHHDSEYIVAYIYEDGVWFCSLCGMSYVKKINLSDHLDTRHSVRLEQFKYRCAQCGIKYTLDHSLQYHLKRKHAYSENLFINDFEETEILSVGKSKNYFMVLNRGLWCCKLCGSKGHDKKMIIYHFRREHGLVLDSEVFKCLICKLRYATREGLMKHVRRSVKHKGKLERVAKWKDNTCAKCGITFRHEINLEIHIELNHSGGPGKESNGEDVMRQNVKQIESFDAEEKNNIDREEFDIGEHITNVDSIEIEESVLCEDLKREAGEKEE